MPAEGKERIRKGRECRGREGKREGRKGKRKWKREEEREKRKEEFQYVNIMSIKQINGIYHIKTLTDLMKMKPAMCLLFLPCFYNFLFTFLLQYFKIIITISTSMPTFSARLLLCKEKEKDSHHKSVVNAH